MQDDSQPVWPASVYCHLKTINEIADDLRALSHAFFVVGNPAVADRLSEYAQLIGDATSGVSTAVHAHINADYKTATDMTGTILKSVLAGAELSRKAS